MAKVKTPVPIASHEPYQLATQTLPGTKATACYYQYNGPFLFSGALWTIAWLSDDVNLPINAYKSVDSGATWTAIDQAGAVQSVNNFPFTFQVCRDGSKLYLLYLNGSPATGLRIRAFDMATGLWGADSPDCPNTDPGMSSQKVDYFGICTFGGVSNIIFTRSHGPAGSDVLDCATVQYDGISTWSGETAFGAEISNAVITGVTTDPSDGTMHVFYSQYIPATFVPAGPISPNPVHHVSVSAGGAVSASDVVFTDAVTLGVTTYPSFGPGVVVGGTLYVPWGKDALNSSSDNFPNLLVGSPGSWASVALTPIDTVGPLLNRVTNTGLSMCCFYFAPWIYVTWLTWPGTGIPQNGTLLYTRTQDGVTFDPIGTLWDPQLNPPPVGPINSATVISSAWIPSEKAISAVFNIDPDGLAPGYRVFLSNGAGAPKVIRHGPAGGGGSGACSPCASSSATQLAAYQRGVQGLGTRRGKLSGLPSVASRLSGLSGASRPSLSAGIPPSISNQFIDIDQSLVFSWNLTANTIQNGLQQPIPRNGDFWLCAMSASCVQVESPDVIVKSSHCGIRISDDLGYKLFSDFLNIDYFTPAIGNSYPFAFNPIHMFKAGTRINIDLAELDDVNSIVQIKFRGRMRYRMSDIQLMRQQIAQDRRSY